MRVSLVKAKVYEDLEMMINDKIMDLIEDEPFRKIVDIKCWNETCPHGENLALILWETEDAEDKTRTGLREEQNRGRYKTW